MASETVEQLELIEKFKPHVYPYCGSGFMTGTESPEVIQMQAEECFKIAESYKDKALKEHALAFGIFIMKDIYKMQTIYPHAMYEEFLKSIKEELNGMV